jgi:hypothetical protein
MNIQAKVLGTLKLVNYTEKRAAALDAQMGAVVAHYGQLMNTRIKANASGRPGPNAPTGDYRRSWAHSLSRDGGSTPYPHVGPAFDEVAPEFVNAAQKLQRSI